MIRAADLDRAVERHRPDPRLRELLQCRLRRALRRAPVDRRRRRGDPVVDVVAHRAQDESARGLEAAVEIDRADDRLVDETGEPEGVSDALQAAAETRAVEQAETRADRGQRGPAHQSGAALGEIPLTRMREAAVQLLADHEPDDRIAEELESLGMLRGA